MVNKKRGKKYIGPIMANGSTYNPKRNVGGINCMHELMFISDDLAISLDDSLELKNDKLVRK